MKMLNIGATVLAGALIVGCGEKKTAQTPEEAAPAEEEIAAVEETLAQAESAVEEIAVVEETPAQAVSAEKTGEEVAPSKDVISVNGTVLTRDALNTQVEAILKTAADGKDIPAEYRKMVAQQQIIQAFVLEHTIIAKAKSENFVVTDAERDERCKELLARVANFAGAPKTPEELFANFPGGPEVAKRELDNGILVDKMIKDAWAKAEKPADLDAKAEALIAEIKASNVGLSEEEALAKIQSLKNELAATPADQVAAKFAELAKAHSDCPSGKRAGGDLEEFTRGMMVKPFEEVAFSAEVGAVSDPVKTPFGYHLIMVTEKIPAVEAKGDAPAEPEKVRASHILVKTADKLPSIEEVKGYLEKEAERNFGMNFLKTQLESAKIESLSPEFDRFVPRKVTTSTEGVETAK